MSSRILALAGVVALACLLVGAPVIDRAKAAEPIPIWIDTDLACGSSASADAGDCWAIAFALRSKQVAVRGISAVTGAIKAGQVAILAADLAKRFGYTGEIFQGAVRKNYRPTAASRAIGAALKKERLTIVALGPLTNIAAVFLTQPKLVGQIDRVVSVFGTPPEITEKDFLTDFRNYNATADTKAVAALMRADIERVIIPIDAGRNAMITNAHLDAVAQGSDDAKWLAGFSRGWVQTWRERIREKGAFPHDSVAIAYLAHPDLFDCQSTLGRFAWRHSFFNEKSALRIADDIKDGRPITYCGAIKPGLRDLLIAAITGSP